MKKLINKIKHPFRTGKSQLSTGLRVGQRIYCIGDIHGRYDLLVRLHELIVEDAINYEHSLRLVYVGDYVDRGMDSKRVVDYLLSKPLVGFECVYLMGNHEQVLLDFLRDPMAGMAWFNFGGLATLASYGVKVLGIPHAAQLQAISSEFKQVISDAHLSFYRQLLPFFEQDGYYFSHAGIKPGVKLKHQQPEDLLWIRDKFLGSKKFHGKVVVHGHSICDQVEILSNRIAVDTGAYESDILSCVVLEGTEQRVLSTKSL